LKYRFRPRKSVQGVQTLGYSKNTNSRIRVWYRQQAAEFAKATGPIRKGNLILVLPSEPQRDAKLTAAVAMSVQSTEDGEAGDFIFGQFRIGEVTHHHPILQGEKYPIVASSLDQFTHFHSEILSFARGVLGLTLDFADAVDLNLVCAFAYEFPVIQERARQASDPFKLGAQLRSEMLAYLNEFVEFHHMWHVHVENLSLDWTRQPVISRLMH